MSIRTCHKCGQQFIGGHRCPADQPKKAPAAVIVPETEPRTAADDAQDAARWRAFIGLEYKIRAEWAANLSLAPVLTKWVDDRVAYLADHPDEK